MDLTKEIHPCCVTSLVNSTKLQVFFPPFFFFCKYPLYFTALKVVFVRIIHF